MRRQQSAGFVAVVVALLCVSGTGAQAQLIPNPAAEDSVRALTVRTYGDVAILQGIADNTGAMGGVPFSGRIRYTRVFVRRDGRWQAVTMQHTPM